MDPLQNRILMAMKLNTHFLNPLILFIILLLSQAIAKTHGPNFLAYNCGSHGHNSNKSSYATNLRHLLTNLNSRPTHFLSLSSGGPPDSVHGLFLCRGGAPSYACLACAQAATYMAQLECPASLQAMAWYDDCFLRYSDRPLAALMEDVPVYLFRLGPAHYGPYAKLLWRSMEVAVDRAVETAGDTASELAFGRVVVNVSAFLALDCYVECTPDLGESECNRCLEAGIGRFKSFDTGGGRYGVLLQPSCRLGYVFKGDSPSPPTCTVASLSAAG